MLNAPRTLGSLVACGGAACLAYSMATSGTALAAGAAISNPTRHVLAYVTETTANAVAVVDTQASPPSVLGTIGVGPTCHPQSVTSSPTLAWVYVGCTGRAHAATTTATGRGAIDVIDTATNTVTDSFPLSADPIATAVSPDGKTLYALSFAGTTPGTPQKFVIDVLSLSGGTPTLTGTVSLPTGQWVNPTALGAIAVGDQGARVAVATSTTKTGTTTGGAVDVYTVTTAGLSPSPQRQFAFSSLAAWAVAFNPAHPTVLYVAPGDAATNASRRSVTIITVNATTTATSQFSWPTVTVGPTGAGQIAVSPNGGTFAVSLTVDGTAYVGPVVATPATAKVLHAVAVPGAPATSADFVTLGPTTTVPPLGVALTPGGTALYVAMAERTTKTVPGQLQVLDAVTKVVATVTLGTIVAAGVAFGQPAAPAPATTTTTTTTSATTTTTTVPPTTTTTVPATTTTAPKGPQLAYTGDDVTPWLALVS